MKSYRDRLHTKLLELLPNKVKKGSSCGSMMYLSCTLMNGVVIERVERSPYDRQSEFFFLSLENDGLHIVGTDKSISDEDCKRVFNALCDSFKRTGNILELVTDETNSKYDTYHVMVNAKWDGRAVTLQFRWVIQTGECVYTYQHNAEVYSFVIIDKDTLTKELERKMIDRLDEATLNGLARLFADDRERLQVGLNEIKREIYNG